MKENLKFTDSKALYFIGNGVLWVLDLAGLYVFIKMFNPYDVMYWIAAVMIYGSTILCSIISYPRFMSKIIIDENGIEKKLFKNCKKNYISWDEAKDYAVIVRPNGYPYLAVSKDKIIEKSLNQVLKNKSIICFTYRQDAYDIISAKIHKVN